MAAAVREGGADPALNGKLRDVILKAKSNNVPNENIDRVIKKASSGENKDKYENVIYEGYGPGGVAVIVETLTDNRNRTAGDMRCYFDKFGGNLGASGCVSFMFSRRGVIVIEQEITDEDKILEDALTAGAEDVIFAQDGVTVYTAPPELSEVSAALERTGYSFAVCNIEQIPSTRVRLSDPEDIEKMRRLLDAFEDNEDVSEVWHNLD